MEAYVFEGLSALVSISISWGIITTKVKHLEREIDTFRKDHDLLVELNTKMDLLLNKRKSK